MSTTGCPVSLLPLFPDSRSSAAHPSNHVLCANKEEAQIPGCRL
nr:hypothetical protein [Nostoc sp. ChiSLP03a]